MLLGLGRTAQVFLAEREGLEVALKLPRKEVRQDPFLRELFAREVNLSLSLRHPHLVQGLWGIPYGEEAFLALEYFPETLETRLEQGPLPFEEAVKALLSVGKALLFLHEKGFLHQDIKPANVFVKEGVYKLGDLGALRPLGERGGKAMGSPHYMAPEVFKGEDPSPLSDAYSFGVMAYELLTGRRPFRGESYEALLEAHLFRPPPPTTLPSQLNRGLRGLLAKEPRERLSLRAFLELLDGFRAKGNPL
ncbi:MAG: serine/threonine-protein kinase [Thermaceae bacterium]